jgi:predicted nucleic acid-binding protein
MTPVLVPDASVILKWLLPPEREPDAEAALYLLDKFVEGDVILAVPTLWYYEVANTVSRLAPGSAGEQLRQLRRLGMAEIAIGDATEARALDCVRRLGVTFYDAVYYATAVELGGELVTADRRFASRIGDHASVVALGNIKVE